MSERAARLWALLACAALVASPWFGHIDDFDAQIYLVVARNMARDHAWFALRYLPSVHPVFREHLPFGLWPAAAAIRVFGEWAVPVVYALFTLGTTWVVGRAGGALGMLLLATCASMFQYGGRLLLDPPLLFFATAAAVCALEDRWRAAAVFAAVGALVKGPFGLLPLACVVIARRRGFWTVPAAAVPLGLFLLVDPAGGWRTHFLFDQLLASLTGARADGITAWWFPLSVVARRFWPGLPFALYGLRKRDPLAIACALLVALLCLPARKWGNHAYVAFPLLAALGGAAVTDARVRWLAPLTAAGALVFCLGGFGARLLRPPCAFSTSLREPLDHLPAHELYVVSKLWDPWAQLAAERDLVPWPVDALPANPSLRWAVVEGAAPVPAGWAVTARGGTFQLLRAAGR